jgi:hypothetical protein
MNRGAVWLLLAAPLPATGCGRPDAPSSAAPAADHFSANGVRYDLPLAGSDAERAAAFLRAVKPDGLSWAGGGHTLEVAGGKVTLDGRPCGAVRPGDRVRLTADGDLFFNDERRRPDR